MRNITDVILLVVDILMVVAGQFLIKHGVGQVGKFGEMGVAKFILGALINIHVITGIGLYALSAIVWLALLSRVELSVAYPMLSLGYVLIVLVAWLFLHEPMTIWKAIGVILIAIGVWLVNR
ncbi:MAG: EamA family transporter [candidate division WOR-3 bacterium]